jgi:hypothetical protein
MNNAAKNLNYLIEEFNLNDFYAINMWKHDNEVSLQGRFTDTNLKIAEALGIKLELEDSFLRGFTHTELGKVRMVLTTNQ